MTPAEQKADKLMQEYFRTITATQGAFVIGKETAKYCALLCVEEIINQIPLICVTEIEKAENKFWNEVKLILERK